VLAAAEVAVGDRVLDVATGPGEAAAMALSRVGPSGLVVGADISPAMLDTASARFAGLRLVRLSFVKTASDSLGCVRLFAKARFVAKPPAAIGLPRRELESQWETEWGRIAPDVAALVGGRSTRRPGLDYAARRPYR
jgi:SAM-dependent methyltransferase